MDLQAFLHSMGKGRSSASCCSRRGAWLGPASAAASGGSRELCECEHSESLKCTEIGSPATAVRVRVPCTKGLGASIPLEAPSGVFSPGFAHHSGHKAVLFPLPCPTPRPHPCGDAVGSCGVTTNFRCRRAKTAHFASPRPCRSAEPLREVNAQLKARCSEPARAQCTAGHPPKRVFLLPWFWSR